MAGLEQAIEEAVAAVDFGVAAARKRGRDPRRPYVPVVEYRNLDRTFNPLRGRAYATRGEAVAAAQRAIDRRRAVLAEQLATPRYRAMREQHGLPRELTG